MLAPQYFLQPIEIDCVKKQKLFLSIVAAAGWEARQKIANSKKRRHESLLNQVLKEEGFFTKVTALAQCARSIVLSPTNRDRLREEAKVVLKRRC